MSHDDSVTVMSMIPESLSGTSAGHPATAHEVGLAESYKAALVYSAGAAGAQAGAPPAAVAPPWLQAVQANIDQQFANLNIELANLRNDLETMRNEHPILLANSQAGTHGPLFDPALPGWALLAAPNPTTRDELFMFSREFLWLEFISYSLISL